MYMYMYIHVRTCVNMLLPADQALHTRGVDLVLLTVSVKDKVIREGFVLAQDNLWLVWREGGREGGRRDQEKEGKREGRMGRGRRKRGRESKMKKEEGVCVDADLECRRYRSGTCQSVPLHFVA